MRASGGGKTPALPTTCGDVASGGAFLHFLSQTGARAVYSLFYKMYRLKSLCVFSTDDPRNICSLVLSVEDEKRKRTFCLLQKGSSAPVRTACGSPSTLARALSSAARRPPRHPAARHVCRRVRILGFRANPRRAASHSPLDPRARRFVLHPSAQSLGPRGALRGRRARRIRPRRVLLLPPAYFRRVHRPPPHRHLRARARSLPLRRGGREVRLRPRAEVRRRRRLRPPERASLRGARVRRRRELRG